MSTYADLCVGDVAIISYRNVVHNEAFALFRDDMLKVGSISASEYFQRTDLPRDKGNEVITAVYSCPGSMVADRLDLMGATMEASLKAMDAWLDDDDAFEAEDPRDGLDWIKAIASAPRQTNFTLIPTPGSIQHSLGLVENDVDERYILRCAIQAFPGAMVTLDLTDVLHSGYLDDYPKLESMASAAVEAVRKSTTDGAPVVVLTEGKTDSEFLSYGLRLLYPHLTDLIRFLDFDQRPEGGSGALVRMIRAFGAAGIANRVIAILDNDTAAADALRVLDRASLPANIRVTQYHPIDLASSYPTLGPPTLEAAADSINLSDVNGLAGSIELYLGQDVLRRSDGSLRPVQWKSYVAGMKTYQGEVIEKDLIQKRFRAKVAAALEDPTVASEQDWAGIREILDVIRKAAQLGARMTVAGLPSIAHFP